MPLVNACDGVHNGGMKTPKKRSKKRRARLAVDVLEARVISLMDERGKRRASLTCFPGREGRGFTLLELLDDAGCPRLTLQVDEKGIPSIGLFTATGGPCVSMSVNEGGSGLSIWGTEKDSGFLMLGVAGTKHNDPRGPGPRLDVVDSKGRRSWSVFDGTIQHPPEQQATSPARKPPPQPSSPIGQKSRRRRPTK
jgi:hypothetical protein